MNESNVTATVKTVDFDEEVETRANNMFVAIKMQRDSDRLNEAAEKRLAEMLAAAGLPGRPSEAETVETIKNQLIDSYRLKRLNVLAERAAQEEFKKLYPEMFEPSGNPQ